MTTTATNIARVSESQAANQLAFANAALAIAGHEITDSYLNELALRQARGEISGETARELGRRYILGR